MAANLVSQSWDAWVDVVVVGVPIFGMEGGWGWQLLLYAGKGGAAWSIY